MADKEYISFEEVLKNLKLEEEQLKRLVSAGEIRAFRDKNTMRFKAEDVARLADKAPAAGDDLELDDLELDLEDLDAPAPAAAPSKAALPAAAPHSDDLEELLLVDEPAVAPKLEELDLGGDATDAEKPVRAGRSTAAAGKRPARAAEPVEVAAEGVGMLSLLVVGLIVLVLANFVVLDAAGGRPSNAVSKAVANLFS
ncbi:MAG: hypothetical protein ACT4PU_12215 [Planctomycetota bacterium]